MKKVKIVMMQEFADDNYSQSIIRDSITDWEEIEDEDYKFLKNNLIRLIRIPHEFGYDMRPILVVADEESPQVRIKGIKKKIVEERKREAAAKAERNAKKREKELKKKAKSEEEEKALLESLKQKYEK